MSGVAHPSAGVTRFDRMPAAWKETTEAVAAGAAIDKASEAAIAVGAAWIQETRDLGLQLTDLLHQPVPVKLNRAERDDPVAFMSRVLDELCGEQALAIEYVIPDGVSNLAVRADLWFSGRTSRRPGCIRASGARSRRRWSIATRRARGFASCMKRTG